MVKSATQSSTQLSDSQLSGHVSGVIAINPFFVMFVDGIGTYGTIGLAENVVLDPSSGSVYLAVY